MSNWIEDMKKHMPEFAKEVAKHLKSDAEKAKGIIGDAYHKIHHDAYRNLSVQQIMHCISEKSYISLEAIFENLYNQKYDYEVKAHGDYLMELQRKLDKLVADNVLVVKVVNEAKFIQRQYRLAHRKYS